jgi:WD40 repeat protein
VRLWDPNTGKAFVNLPDEETNFAMDSIAFSPSGNEIFATRRKGQILQVCDCSSGKELRRLKLSGRLAAKAYRIAFSRDGSRLAVGDSDGKALNIYDTGTGKKVVAIVPAVALDDIAFRPDAKELVYTGDGVRVMDLSAGKNPFNNSKLVPRLVSETDAVAFAYSRDGKTIATVAGGNIVTFWAATTGEAMLSFHVPDGQVEHLLFPADTKRLLTANRGDDGVISAWDLAGPLDN